MDLIAGICVADVDIFPKPLPQRTGFACVSEFLALSEQLGLALPFGHPVSIR
jgi:hypothetical protein